MTRLQKLRARDKFREQVFTRDKFTCQFCGQPGNQRTLDAHHITDPSYFKNGGYVLENGISLCRRKCAVAAKKFQMTGGKEYVEGLHPTDLYNKISSSITHAEMADNDFKKEKKLYASQLKKIKKTAIKQSLK